MHRFLRQMLDQIRIKNAKRRKRHLAVLVLSLFVASGVLWQLKITGITMTGEALCGYLEHQHSEQCVEKALSCGLAESEPHTHTDECVGENSVLVCGLEESEGHAHSAECCTEEYVCGLEESEDHTHGPECRVVTYVCGLEESEGHSHSSGCYAKEYICGLEESEGHIHTDACYSEGYVCGYEEHVHSPLCYSDRDADLETSAVWEATLPGLTGDPAADLVAVARSQIGYTESQQNYVVSDDGSTQRGYTRYGEWYGNPYGSWSAMFVSFCLNYAQHPAYQGLANSGAETMRLAADSLGYCRDAGYLPNPGDLVFLDRDGNGAADGVAVVTGWNEESFNAVEGDCGNAVQELSYAVDSSVILAYARLTESDSASFMLLDDGEDDIALTSETEETSGTIFGTMEGYSNIYTVTLNVQYVPVDQNGNALNVSSYSDASSTFYSGYVTSDGGVMGYASNVFSNHVSSLGYNLGIDDLYRVTIRYDTSNGTATGEQPVYVNVTNDLYYFQINQSNLHIGKTGNIVVTADLNPYMIVYYIANPVTVTFTDGENTISTQENVYPGTVIDLGTIGDYVIGTTTNSDGAVLSGWQDESGNVYTTSVTVGGSPMNLTPVWSSGMVTVTFRYTAWDEETGDETTGEFVYTLLANQPLRTAMDGSGNTIAELPNPPEMEGYVFTGWFADGEDTAVTLDTVISENTIFTAEYDEVTYYTVTFYDITPEEETSDISIDLLAEDGQTLSEVIELWDASLEDGTEDGTMLSDCVWYTLAADGTRTKIDPANTVVEGDMDLYTYTYRITLTLNPQSAQTYTTRSIVNVTTDDSGTMTMTITAREGEPISASDFVVDGVDYSLYTWTYTDSNNTTQTLDISELIENGATENITATSSTSDLAISPSETTTKSIRFFVFLDDGRVLVETRTVTAYRFSDTGNRWYIPAATLESVYAQYGFKAEQLQDGTHYFPHVDSDGGTIWGDTAVKGITINSQTLYFSPIINNNNAGCDVYYLPAQTITSSSAWNDQDLIAENTFYTVTVSDPAQKVYTADTLPGVTYTLTGNTANVTVETPEGVSWQCVGQDETTIIGTDNGNGTTTFTISSISQPYVISPALSTDEVMITYDIHLPGTPSDAEYGTPTIEGGSTYSTLVSGETYTVLAPSLTSYFFTSGKYLGEAEFLGWSVNGSETNLVQPGEALNLADYGGQTVTLTAQWSTKLGGTNDREGSMVNFFVSLAALPEGTTSLEGSTSKDTFTTSVYTVDCGVDGSIVVNDAELYRERSADGTQYFVLGNTSIENLNDSHTQIVSELTAGYTLTGTDGIDYTYSASFPTDEQVLQTVRQMVASGQVITINGHTLTDDELTSENFTIKWYVFKYDTSDGWHIDGYLIAKAGELVVQKTFAGDPTGIQNIKDNAEKPYSINVAAVENQTGIVHTGGTLTLDAGSYNEATNTYTWKVPVDQFYNYTVTEQNYSYTEDLFTTNARYNVSNSNTDSQNTNGWTTYSSSVTVTGRGYNEGDSGRLTVAFLNTYTAPGTVILQKVDAATGNLMPGVSFTIAKQGDAGFSMADLGGGSYSAADSGTNTITTDYSGQAYLWIGGGTYTFQEQVPTGYDDPGTITAELAGSSDNQYKVISITGLTAENGDIFVASRTGSLELIVRNYSRTIDLTVEKIWADGENKPVTIQLYRNGVAMGAGYTVTFDGTIDSTETTPWKCRFEGLPLYADGGLAQYTLREEALGDFKYSEEYTDGYRYYDVTYSGMSYLDGNGAVTTEMSDVATIALSVTNSRSTGALSIQKVDNNGAAVAGAEFLLYAVADTGGTPDPVTVDKDTDGHNVLSGNLVKTATSDSNGLVSFGNMDAGRYYLIEHAAPANYAGSDDLYLLVLTDSGTAMYRWNAADSSWTEVPGKQVVNTYLVADLTIKKVDQNNNPLTGAKFELYKDNQKVTIGNQTAFDVDANGQLTFQDLAPGSYTLREIGAPAGYYRLAEDIDFTVSEGKITCTSSDGKWSFSDTDNTFTITVTNVAGSELPHTGGMGTLYGTMVGLLMMAGSLYAILLRRKRERGAV